MKIAVTGANGFVGSHLVRYLSKRKIETVGVVRKGREDVVEYCGGKPKAVDYFSLDSLEDAFTDADAVFHFGGAISGKNVNYKKDYIELSKNVIIASEKAGVGKIIFNSGLGVANYGKKVHATNEYFLAKIKVEELIKESKLNYVIFRPTTIIGSGDEMIPSDELTPSIMESLARGQETRIIGSGKEFFQPIWIEDVCEIYFRCLKEHDRKIFDLAGPEKVTFFDYANLIAKILGKELRVRFLDEEESVKIFSKVLTDIYMLDNVGDPKIIEKSFGIKLKKVSEIIGRIIKEISSSQEF